LRRLQPPQPFDEVQGLRVFLAGSIEMGRAAHWQAEVAEALADLEGLVLLDPRREDWDSSWRQDIAEPQFAAQVRWELAGLEAADLVAMVLLPDTKAPISLLELGLTVRRKPLLVCCPEGYWRRGNVQVVLDRYGGELVDEFPVFLRRLRAWVEARRGTLVRAAPESRELDELEEEIRRDPSEGRLQAYWNQLRRLGVVEEEAFGFELPETRGAGRSPWVADFSLQVRRLETLAKELGEELPAELLRPWGGAEGAPPAHWALLDRRVHLELSQLHALVDIQGQLDREPFWQQGIREELPAPVERAVRGFRRRVEVPARAFLADPAGWVRAEGRRAVSALALELRDALRG